MTFEPIWSGIIACYLFLGGLGGGAFATSAFLAWRHPEAVNMRKIGHIIAPIVVIIGLVLMFDAKASLYNPAALRSVADELWVCDDLGRRYPGAVRDCGFDRHDPRPYKASRPRGIELAGSILHLRRHLHWLPARRVQHVPAVEQRAAADSVPRLGNVDWHGIRAARRRVQAP